MRNPEVFLVEPSATEEARRGAATETNSADGEPASANESADVEATQKDGIPFKGDVVREPDRIASAPSEGESDLDRSAPDVADDVTQNGLAEVLDTARVEAVHGGSEADDAEGAGEEPGDDDNNDDDGDDNDGDDDDGVQEDTGLTLRGTKAAAEL